MENKGIGMDDRRWRNIIRVWQFFFRWIFPGFYLLLVRSSYYVPLFDGLFQFQKRHRLKDTLCDPFSRISFIENRRDAESCKYFEKKKITYVEFNDSVINASKR